MEYEHCKHSPLFSGDLSLFGDIACDDSSWWQAISPSVFYKSIKYGICDSKHSFASGLVVSSVVHSDIIAT